jgi:hypothetical protein
MRRPTLVALSGFLILLLAGPSAQAQEDHLKCYKVKDPVRLKGVDAADKTLKYWLDLDPTLLGTNEDCKIVGGFRLYCVPVAKQINPAATIQRKHAGVPGSQWTDITPAPIAGPVEAEKVCYKIKCDPDTSLARGFQLTITDQFESERTVEVVKPDLLCGPAIQGPLPPPDHYNMYVRDIAPSFAPIQTDFTDQFQSWTSSVGAVQFFMVPVDKNGEGITDPNTHQTGYQTSGPGQTRFLEVDNQFGSSQLLTISSPQYVFVPTEKCVGVPPGDPPCSWAPGPLLTPANRDHFMCYVVTSGTPINQSVTLTDQFRTTGTTVTTPNWFCNPVDKNGEGIQDPEDHLTCYLVNQIPFGPTPVSIRNQFHQFDGTTIPTPQFAIGDLIGLCVPSTKVRWDTQPLP